MIKNILILSYMIVLGQSSGAQTPVAEISVNQVAYDTRAPKIAVVSVSKRIDGLKFQVLDLSKKKIAEARLYPVTGTIDWAPAKVYYQGEFTSLQQPGEYITAVISGKDTSFSAPFTIADNALSRLTLPSIIHYYNKQRANTSQEQEADKQVLLYGSKETVDIRGGWCDASGDISKYFSHLAYTNYMLPQQTPLVTWSMINAREKMESLLNELGSKPALESEALWGADYLMRSLSSKGFFYMTVFSYFKPDPKERRIVGLLANSVTTSDYQCAFREGAGMAIAALARISRWNKEGEFSSAQYLDAARRAFAHLQENNLRYTDDGKENILDDYCALMAATELWIATGENTYRGEARKRAGNLCKRISPAGYFIANDNGRPFWHASDAGMPVIALSRYLQKEEEMGFREQAIQTIRKFLNYQLKITNIENNAFGYARQTFIYNKKITEGFFIPHENESGWWWQGENARLASLATAAMAGGKLAFRDDEVTQEQLRKFSWRQLSWILGCNPYNMCFMYGFGKNNVPYMASMFGHGSEKGGISNGITGKDGAPDGSGIDFKKEAGGNEWRWTEQWIPHAAWFLQALTALND
ncbi:glycoside hydrolase family 9 protein [Terrimonas sp. NA20]|uniref:Glycoside hydrolase family 9 protein n=1 Tax=Terrimonas ginsenosidimutans TaxID=2908004 RepID=A0ABS9KNY6_9BACT|nr:glycoside hydrolase family 9 protein [Terrimonas ginsenosidimutans]MCG2614009.1 glycoside hydrolase family 9 protein [Terrimonas ginsenosidimutans]